LHNFLFCLSYSLRLCFFSFFLQLQALDLEKEQCWSPSIMGFGQADTLDSEHLWHPRIVHENSTRWKDLCWFGMFLRVLVLWRTSLSSPAPSDQASMISCSSNAELKELIGLRSFPMVWFPKPCFFCWVPKFYREIEADLRTLIIMLMKNRGSMSYLCVVWWAILKVAWWSKNC
jgi:hypothetical protein